MPKRILTMPELEAKVNNCRPMIMQVFVRFEGIWYAGVSTTWGVLLSIQEVTTAGATICVHKQLFDLMYKAIANRMTRKHHLFIQALNKTPVKNYLVQTERNVLEKTGILKLRYLRETGIYYTEAGEPLNERGIHVIAEIPADRMEHSKAIIKVERAARKR